jgi:hypothetical protein
MHARNSSHEHLTCALVLLPEGIREDVVRTRIAQLRELDILDRVERRDVPEVPIQYVRGFERSRVRRLPVGEVRNLSEVRRKALAVLVREGDAHDDEPLSGRHGAVGSLCEKRAGGRKVRPAQREHIGEATTSIKMVIVSGRECYGPACFDTSKP